MLSVLVRVNGVSWARNLCLKQAVDFGRFGRVATHPEEVGKGWRSEPGGGEGWGRGGLASPSCWICGERG
jgi:hypothetical protein